MLFRSDAATGVAKELAPAPALPEPESPASAAPFSFDPAVQATPEQMPPAAAEQPAAKPPRKSKKKRAEEPRPSMFPAPETLVEPNGEIP